MEKGYEPMKINVQSAMEYLMTYGWAILIIAVILGALFSLGFFNSASLAPKVSPGACVVERPYGPGTSAYATLQGTCNNELPEYAASFVGADFSPSNTVGHICSSSSPGVYCISISLNTVALNSCNVTMAAWAYDTGLGPGGNFPYPINQWITGNALPIPSNFFMGGVIGMDNIGVAIPANVGAAMSLEYNDTLIRYELANASNRYEYFHAGNFKNRWIQVAEVIKAGHAYGYLNGQEVASASNFQACAYINDIRVGSWDFPFHGYIANIQVYNTSLSSEAVKTLYDEGIGGVPIYLNKVIAWWPLNGNSNDYSGNQNNGDNANIVYTNSWTYGYSAP